MGRSKKRKIRNQLDAAARTIIDNLKREGVIIQRYDSYSTNSIYLKLDYGVSNSIRISDHRGKRHLAYRYNALTCCPYPIKSVDKKSYVRFYYPINQVEMLVDKILFDRSTKLSMYGFNRYHEYMLINQAQGQRKSGFWQSARLV